MKGFNEGDRAGEQVVGVLESGVMVLLVVLGEEGGVRDLDLGGKMVQQHLAQMFAFDLRSPFSKLSVELVFAGEFDVEEMN